MNGFESMTGRLGAMRRRLKSRRGFTLAEMMLAMLILLMVSSIVAAGIPVAKNAYEKVILGSNAQLLLSTAANALRDELGTAWDVQIKDGVISYYSASTGAPTTLEVKENVIWRQRYAGDAFVDNYTAEAHRLLSEAATDQFHVVYDSVSADGDTVVFSGLKVTNKEGGPLAEMDAANPLRIRVFSMKA